MRQPLLICDLDGTLVNSQPGIVEAFRQACFATGIEPLKPPEELSAGAPLNELLQTMTGLADEQTLEQLKVAFVAAYDGGACQRIEPFVGVEEMMETLLARGINLALATNKRQAATSLILETLGWRTRFRNIECVDSRPASPRSKAKMLRDILASVEPSITAYMGDMPADVEAASEASLPFILAAWGYGGVRIGKTTVAHFPEDVVDAFATAASQPGI